MTSPFFLAQCLPPVVDLTLGKYANSFGGWAVHSFWQHDFAYSQRKVKATVYASRRIFWQQKQGATYLRRVAFRMAKKNLR
jgi:hypothetical protein